MGPLIFHMDTGWVTQLWRPYLYRITLVSENSMFACTILSVSGAQSLLPIHFSSIQHAESFSFFFFTTVWASFYLSFLSIVLPVTECHSFCKDVWLRAYILRGK